MITSRYIKIEQPIGVFYMTVLNARDLALIVDVNRRGEGDNNGGVQRWLNKERWMSIKDYTSDTDATFPTPIIVSVYNEANVTLSEDGTIIIDCDRNNKLGDVIDGQHRLAGLECSQYIDKFDIPVVLMFNLTLEEKAYVFSIINSTQTKVSMSLIYDLFDLSERRSPHKTCHEIARALNKMEDSPLHNRMKMLGKKAEGQDLATISQGSFIHFLMPLISKHPEDDRRNMKRDELIDDDDRCPFRKYFLANRDDIILKILTNCLSAMREVFPSEYNNPQQNIMWKTTGIGGLMKAMPQLYSIGDKEDDLSKAFFGKCFEKFRIYMSLKEESLDGHQFTGGGETLQRQYSNYLIDSQYLSLDANYTTDFSAFVFMIDLEDYNDIYELYEASVGKADVTNLFANKKTGGIHCIIYVPTEVILQLTENKLKELPRWIEKNLMDDMDAESYFSLNRDKEKN